METLRKSIRRTLLFWVINNMLVCRFCFNSANRMATFVLDVYISAVFPLSILTDGSAESGRFGCNLWKSLGEGLSCLRISKAAGESFRKFMGRGLGYFRIQVHAQRSFCENL